MAEYLQIPNWDSYQHYKNRNPPWIKFHNSMMDDYSFTSLPDATRCHLMLLWLLASRTNNKIPFDKPWIEQSIRSTEPVDYAKLIEAGFIELIREENQGVSIKAAPRLQIASTTQAPRKQSAMPSREEESREEKSREEERTSDDANASVPLQAKKKRKRKVVEYTDDFEKFWENRPRRSGTNATGGKQKTFKNWKIVLEKNTVAEIMGGQNAYKGYLDRNGTDPQYFKKMEHLLEDDNWKADNFLATTLGRIPIDIDT